MGHNLENKLGVAINRVSGSPGVALLDSKGWPRSFDWRKFLERV